MGKDNSLITNDVSVLNNDKTLFTSIDLSEAENKAKLYNSLQKCDVRINDIIGLCSMEKFRKCCKKGNAFL